MASSSSSSSSSTNSLTGAFAGMMSAMSTIDNRIAELEAEVKALKSSRNSSQSSPSSQVQQHQASRIEEADALYAQELARLDARNMNQLKADSLYAQNIASSQNQGYARVQDKSKLRLKESMAHNAAMIRAYEEDRLARVKMASSQTPRPSNMDFKDIGVDDDVLRNSLEKGWLTIYDPRVVEGAKIDRSYTDSSLVIGVSMVASPPNAKGERLISTIPCCSVIATYQCAPLRKIETVDRGTFLVHSFNVSGAYSPWAIYLTMCKIEGWNGLSAGRMPETKHIECMALYLDAKITCIYAAYLKDGVTLRLNGEDVVGKDNVHSTHVKIILSDNHYITNNDGASNLKLRNAALEAYEQ